MKKKIVLLSTAILLGSGSSLFLTSCQKDYDGQLEILRNQIKNGVVNLNELNAKLVLVQEQITTLENALKEAEDSHKADIAALIQDLKNVKEELTAKIADLQAQLNAAQTDIDTLKGLIESAEQNFNTKLLEISSRIDQVDVSLNLLDGRVTKLEDQMKAIHEKQALVDKTIEGLEKEIKDLQNQPHTPDLTDKVNQLETALKEMQETSNSLQKNVSDLEALINKVKEASEKKDAELESLINQAAKDIVEVQTTLDSKIQSLSSQMTGFSDSLKALNSSIKIINENYNALDSKVNNLKNQYDDQIKKIWNAINDASKDNAQDEEINKLKTVVNELQASLDSYNEAIMAEVTKILERQKLFGGKLDDLTKTVETYEKKLNDFSGQLEQLNAKVTELEKWKNDFVKIYGSTIIDIQNAIKSLKNDLTAQGNQHSADIKFLEDQLDSLKKEFNDKVKELNNSQVDLANNLADFQNQVDLHFIGIDNNMKILMMRMGKSEDEIKELTSFVNELNDNLTTLSSNFGDLKKVVNDNQEKIINLNSRIDALTGDKSPFYTKAQIDQMLKDYNVKVQNTFADVYDQIKTKANKTEVENKFEEVNGEIANIKTDIEALKKRLTSLEDKVNDLINRVQSMQIVPDYSTGAVKLIQDMKLNKSELYLKVKVNPTDCIDEILKVDGCIKVDVQPVIPIRSAAGVPDFKVESVKKIGDGMIEVKATSDYIVNQNSTDKDLTFQVAVSLRYGYNDRTSNYAGVRYNVPKVVDENVEYTFYFNNGDQVNAQTKTSSADFTAEQKYELPILVSKTNSSGDRIVQLPAYPQALVPNPVTAVNPEGNKKYYVKYSFAGAFNQKDEPATALYNFIGVTSDGKIEMKLDLVQEMAGTTTLEDYSIIVGMQAFESNTVYGKKSNVCIKLKKNPNK